ncbi:hypothetical protein BUALT_Bualt05G0151200 [Buddleja alternifolia]|uniref:Strictosidine synthase conserved region domain-containing protein n=1 Tax=Buddleja alternifolia TaxID=168488 RepID=A0AAV6XVU2_9LAMI|nr:hypothetical protein BUALT_Bualt05G0151200 [Buddleja alternifolia]
MVQIMLIIFFFFFFQYIAPAQSYHSFKSFKLPSIGSEAYAFDSKNGGPYTGLNDGRIVKYHGPELGFQEFASTSANRSRGLCDGKNADDPKIGPTCGKTIGLEFNHITGDLYIADAFYGIMVVGSGGGIARPLCHGMHFDYPDGIAIDQTTGDIYLSDLGSVFTRTNNMTEILLKGDSTGRLLKYDPKTNETTVLLTRLAMPAGLVVSRDGSFVLITEYVECRITRYWLKGPKANTTDIFVNLPGNPDNIKRTRTGDFWVAVNIHKVHPQLTVFPLGQKISPDGRILETVNFYQEYNATYITEVQENGGMLYVASIYTDFAGVYRGLKC